MKTKVLSVIAPAVLLLAATATSATAANVVGGPVPVRPPIVVGPPVSPSPPIHYHPVGPTPITPINPGGPIMRSPSPGPIEPL